MSAKAFMLLVLFAAAAWAKDEPSVKGPEDPAVAHAMAACGPEQVNFDVAKDLAAQPSVAPESKALVFMISEGFPDPSLAKITTKVGLDGSWVGANHGPSYFSFSVASGEHHLCVRWQSRLSYLKRVVALYNFTAESGKTYYFRSRPFDSGVGPVLDLDLINSDQGKLFVASYPVSTSHAKQ